MAILFKEIVRRSKINGIDLPVIGGGIAWENKPSEKDVIGRLFIFLADKRALYNRWEDEMPDYVVEAVLKIRERLTDDLQQIDPSSKLAPVVRDMQIACHEFLTITQSMKKDYDYSTWNNKEGKRFFIELGKLRHRFGIHIASLAVSLNVDVDERMEPILPGGRLF